METTNKGVDKRELVNRVIVYEGLIDSNNRVIKSIKDMQRYAKKSLSIDLASDEVERYLEENLEHQINIAIIKKDIEIINSKECVK